MLEAARSSSLEHAAEKSRNHCHRGRAALPAPRSRFTIEQRFSACAHDSLMNVLRFLMLLSLAVWLGGLIFFPILAQTSFSVVPSTHLAGLVVRDSLLKLHWMGFASGLVFLASSLIYNRTLFGRTRIFGMSHILVIIMLALTTISQFRMIPRMDTLRTSAGEIGSLAANNPLRLEFDSLHAWSTRLEETVLLLGLVALYSTSRRIASPQS